MDTVIDDDGRWFTVVVVSKYRGSPISRHMDGWNAVSFA